MVPLVGRLALVTGGPGGIGRAIALDLAGVCVRVSTISIEARPARPRPS